MATILVLAACSIEISSSESDDAGGRAEGHNLADVSFSSEMIPHHAQVLAMVSMTEGRDLDPDFERLTEDIRAAQEPEIDLMAGWLRGWGEDVPRGWGMGAGGMGTDREDMRDLMGPQGGPMWRDTSASRFQDMWLRMMILHHEGAIEMAEQELDEGKYQPTKDLAQAVITGQRAEIDEMNTLIAGLPA